MDPLNWIEYVFSDGFLDYDFKIYVYLAGQGRRSQ